MPYVLPQFPAEPIAPRGPQFLHRAEFKRYDDQKDAYESVRTSYGKLRECYDAIMRCKQSIDIRHPQDCATLERDGESNELYKIVCPYCLERYSVDELQFRAVEAQSYNGEAAGFEPEEDSVYEEYWTKMGISFIEPLRGHILSMDPDDGEIKTITFAMNADGSQTDTVPFSAKSIRLMKKYKVHHVTDQYGLDTYSRICPKCHTELPGDIGFVPNYIYTLMGNSSCGKTVYLYRLLLDLCEGRMLQGNISAFEMNTEMAKPYTSFSDIARRTFMYTGESMADATDVKYIPPIILRIGDGRNQFLVTLFDYPGEAIWNDDSFFQPLNARVRANANGMLIMVDSGVSLDKHLDAVHRVVPEGADDFSKERKSARDILTQIYGNAFGYNAVGMPVAFVLSKSDLIGSILSEVKDGQGLKTDFLNPSAPHSMLQLHEICTCHNQICDYLGRYEPGAEMVAKQMTAGNRTWFAVSATGIPMEEGIVPENANLMGIRTMDPLEWLLYRNGHIRADDTGCDPTILRWAASLQTIQFKQLEEYERQWDGDPTQGIPSLYDEYKAAFEHYNQL